MQSLVQSNASRLNPTNRPFYANINDLPTELLSTIFEEIRKSQFRRALMPLNRSLEVYYLKNLYYDVYLDLEQVPILLESIGEKLELLKLITILTIREINGDDENPIYRSNVLLTVGQLLDSASEVNELNLIGRGPFKSYWERKLRPSLAARTILGRRPRTIMPLLSRLHLGGGYEVPLVRLLDFIESHPLLKSLHLGIDPATDNEFDDLLPGLTQIESISMENSHFEHILDFLPAFIGIERLDLIVSREETVQDSEAINLGEILEAAVERGVGNVKYLKFGLIGKNMDRSYRYAGHLYPSLRESLSKFRCLETLEINFPLAEEKVYEMILEDLPQLRVLIIDGQTKITADKLEESVGKLEAQGRRFTIQLDRLNFENPGKRGLSYDIPINDLEPRMRDVAVRNRDGLSWKLEIDDSWKRSEPNFDGLVLEEVRDIFRISQESKLVDVVTVNLIKAVENEEAYRKEIEFCRKLATPALRFPVVVVEYYEESDFALNAEEEEEKSTEGIIGMLELQDEPYRVELERLLDISVGMTLYLKPAGWKRPIWLEFVFGHPKAPASWGAGLLSPIKIRSEQDYVAGLEAIKSVCEEIGKNRKWKVEVKISKYVVKLTRLADEGIEQ